MSGGSLELDRGRDKWAGSSVPVFHRPLPHLASQGLPPWPRPRPPFKGRLIRPTLSGVASTSIAIAVRFRRPRPPSRHVQNRLPGRVSNPRRVADDPCSQRLGAHSGHSSADEAGRSPVRGLVRREGRPGRSPAVVLPVETQSCSPCTSSVLPVRCGGRTRCSPS